MTIKQQAQYWASRMSKGFSTLSAALPKTPSDIDQVAQAKAALGGDLQDGGARTSNAGALNYLSVTTLDPTVLARHFKAADAGDLTGQATTFELIEEQDTHVFSELSKRRRAVTSLPWQLTPPDDASEAELKATIELGDMIKGIANFEDALYDLTDGISKGFAALELDWQTGSTWLPKRMLWVPQRSFTLLDGKRELGLKRDNSVVEPLRPCGWVVHEHRAKSGYIESAALFRVLAWAYCYKAYNLRDMQRFLEVYGMPLRLGKYPSGIGKDQRNELLRAVRNIGSDSAGVVPNTMQIEFIQAMQGKASDFLQAVEYWERKQSIAVLGGTLTSQADGKSSTNALGQVHEVVRREILMHDVQQLAPTITRQLMLPICVFNGIFKPERMPRFTFDTEEAVDQQAVVDMLDKAVSLGMKVSVDWAHKKLQIPQAGEKELVLGKAAAPDETTPTGPMTKPATKGAAASAAALRLAEVALGQQQDAQAEDDPAGLIARRLADLAAQDEAKQVQAIMAMVAEAEDFDAALAGIAKLAAQKPSNTVVERIAQGLTLANLVAKDEVVRVG